MSHAVKQFIADNVRGITPTERVVLDALANYSNPAGTSCFPSLRRIADRLDLSVRTVRAKIKQLTAKGLLVVVPPPKIGKSWFNHYGIVMGRSVDWVLQRVKAEADRRWSARLKPEEPMRAPVPDPVPRARAKPTTPEPCYENPLFTHDPGPRFPRSQEVSDLIRSVRAGLGPVRVGVATRNPYRRRE